ncbi:hypothetical protein CRE_11000 [Caenorhabditis remanei]|uniref:Uncharacterized protein n=1 Tax=Caenorhabditis remanei TaxID=31234 RepID=E3M5X5_CAERE|nr:hypothetical protein CRE_11000 [Caenorhabditis remanei]
MQLSKTQCTARFSQPEIAGKGKKSRKKLTYTQFPIERMSLSVPVEKWISAGLSFPTEYLTEQRSSFRPKPANSESPAVRIVSSKKRTPNHMFLY